MAKLVEGAGSPPKEITTISLTENETKGIKDLKVDDKVTIILEGKVTKVGRRMYDDKKPLEASFSVQKAILGDDLKLGKVKKARTEKELDEAMDDD